MVDTKKKESALGANFCIPKVLPNAINAKTGAITLPPAIAKRVEDRYSIITEHLDRFWCHHGILKNNIIKWEHISETEASGAEAGATATAATATVARGAEAGREAIRTEPWGKIRIIFQKESCGCEGQLLIDAGSLAALTPFYPAPFRKKKGIEVGTDEVGRGCLFGPVTSAAVIWPPDLDTEWTRRMIKDSKLLSETQREEAYQFILENAISWGVASLDQDEIDRTDILKASIRAMHLAIRETYIEPDHILVDGTQFKFFLDRENMQVSHTCIPKGDNRYYSIAAASIIAKVTRDRWVTALAVEHPELDERYGIAGNKGYGAKVHMDGIRKWGITKWHRQSFRPCREAVLRQFEQK